MGFSETKNDIIRKLVAVKKTKDKALSIAGAEKTAKETLLTATTNMNECDHANLRNAEAMIEPSVAVNGVLQNLLKEIGESCDASKKLQAEVLTMVKIAHTATIKTIALAGVMDALSDQLARDVERNKVILNLLVKDAQKAQADAKTAVSLATKALVDTITVAESVCYLQNSLHSTKTCLMSGLPLVANKSDGLNQALHALKVKAQKMYKQSLKEEKKAETACAEATKTFNELTIESSNANAALNAANAAVGSVN